MKALKKGTDSIDSSVHDFILLLVTRASSLFTHHHKINIILEKERRQHTKLYSSIVTPI